MSYIDGFVIAVPSANRQAFIEHATKFDTMLVEAGALRVVEAWGEDVPRGKQTDFYGAVDAKDDETVCFSWIEWPDKQTRNAVHARMEQMMSDGTMDGDPHDMPFDGKRMVFGGFEAIVEEGRWTPGAYVQGFVLPGTDREAYRKMAQDAWTMFEGYGALQVVECWQDDVPHGKQTDFFRAIEAEDGESVVFSWMLWPSKAVCDAASEKMQSDDSMQMPEVVPFNPQRMIFAGFVPVVELGGN